MFLPDTLRACIPAESRFSTRQNRKAQAKITGLNSSASESDGVPPKTEVMDEKLLLSNHVRSQ